MYIAPGLMMLYACLVQGSTIPVHAALCTRNADLSSNQNLFRASLCFGFAMMPVVVSGVEMGDPCFLNSRNFRPCGTKEVKNNTILGRGESSQTCSFGTLPIHTHNKTCKQRPNPRSSQA